MISNRQIEMLYDQWNPNSVMVGDRVMVNLHNSKYQARIVGLNLDIKNYKEGNYEFTNKKITYKNFEKTSIKKIKKFIKK